MPVVTTSDHYRHIYAMAYSVRFVTYLRCAVMPTQPVVYISVRDTTHSSIVSLCTRLSECRCSVLTTTCSGR